jgi:hypothetical protein
MSDPYDLHHASLASDDGMPEAGVADEQPTPSPSPPPSSPATS